MKLVWWCGIAVLAAALGAGLLGGANALAVRHSAPAGALLPLDLTPASSDETSPSDLAYSDESTVAPAAPAADAAPTELAGPDPEADHLPPADDCDCHPGDTVSHFVVYINDKDRPETHIFSFGTPSMIRVEIHNWPYHCPARFKLSQRAAKGQSAVQILNDDLTPADENKVYAVYSGQTVSVKATGKVSGDEVEITASSAK